jgi:hypothetical protein
MGRSCPGVLVFAVWRSPSRHRVCVQGLFGGGLQGLGVVGGWERCNIVEVQEGPIGHDVAGTRADVNGVVMVAPLS